MPILDVELVSGEGEDLPGDLASRIADAAGAAFGSPSGTTWVRLRILPRDRYAESGGGPPPGVQPVFVSVLRRRMPPADQHREEVRRLTLEIARLAGRAPENVHVLYQPEAAGRMAFGGEIVE